jgi:beta-ketodecanoyl-[acyl-carrier-protein] synthase
MTTKRVAITTTGYFLPPEIISNTEISKSYNQYAELYNQKLLTHNELNSDALLLSDEDFISKASGINQRHVLDKKGILDICSMKPIIAQRKNSEISVQSEFGFKAALCALNKIQRSVRDIDGVIVACSNMQRAYPAIAIEIQQALGIEGWAYDMNAACSSASFGISAGYNSIKGGGAKSILVITPEMYTAHINFKDRKSHFIFGDGASAVLIEEVDDKTSGFEILGCQLKTLFSNSIRNNFGFLNRAEGRSDMCAPDLYFTQDGRKVREEVVPFAIDHINKHMRELGINSADLKRIWLHQSNSHMNNDIAKGVFGENVSLSKAP